MTDQSPAWCRRLLSELQASDTRATALAKPLSVEQLNWKPGPGVWSVGQCLEHLIKGAETYHDPIVESLRGRPKAVVDAITPGWFGAWFIRRFIEPSPGRAKAPPTIVPSVEVDASILTRFLDTNEKNRALIRLAADYDVNRIRFRNPFVGVIRFTVGTGLEILSAHERRHLLQAERVRESAGFPPPSTDTAR